MAKRQAVADRVYVSKDGSEHRTPRKDTEALRFDFKNGKVLTFDLAKLHKDLRHVAMCHGLSQKVGDAWSGVKGDFDTAVDSATSMVERLSEGIWVEKRESAGPSTGLLVEAIVRAKIAEGEPAADFTDERKAEIAGKLKGETPEETKAKREGALANPSIKAAYEAIRAERAAAKAAEAAKAAKAAPTESTDLGAY